MPYLPYFIKKREMVIKSCNLQTHESIWEQFQRQINNPAFQQDKIADS